MINRSSEACSSLNFLLSFSDGSTNGHCQQYEEVEIPVPWGKIAGRFIEYLRIMQFISKSNCFFSPAIRQMVGQQRCPTGIGSTWMAGQLRHIRSLDTTVAREYEYLGIGSAWAWTVNALPARNELLRILGWRFIDSTHCQTLWMDKNLTVGSFAWRSPEFHVCSIISRRS